MRRIHAAELISVHATAAARFLLLSEERDDLGSSDSRVAGDQGDLVNKTCRGNDFIRGIASKIQSNRSACHLGRERPNRHLAKGIVDRRSVQIDVNPAERRELLDFPKDDCRNAPAAFRKRSAFPGRQFVRKSEQEDVGIKI